MNRITVRPSREDLSQKEQLVVKTLMEAVAFCVYDKNKVEEIFSVCRDFLSARCGISFDYNVTWNAPTISVDTYFDSLSRFEIPN